MSTTVKTFRNRENYAKYLALYFEPGVTVLLTTLEWCYKGQLPIKDHLADLGATNSLRKTNIINATEQNTFVELKEGKTELNNLDITILYKVIQLTCELLPRNTNVWTKDCPAPQQGELEFLLFKLKDGRNKLAHPHDELKNITDSMVEDKCEEIKDLLTKILQAAASKSNVQPDKLSEVVDHIQDDVQRISSGDSVCDSMKPHTINLILADLKSKAYSNDELKSSLMNEIKEYSAPTLKSNDGLHPLKDILQLNNSPAIVVKGEAGRGKTTMSRFLYYSWLSGNMNSMEGLSLFDVVLRVDCSQFYRSDIHLLYETLFPTASFAFSNTVSLKKSLDKYKVFWIMDGFDESTDAFKGFLTDMTYLMSDKHKLLITTRPNTYNNLERYLSELSLTSVTLELFQDHNVEEVIQSLIIDNDNEKAFKTHFHSLDETAKHLLRTPVNLNLYIKLWIEDPKLVRDTFTTKMLFLETSRNNLSLLKKRLVNHNSCSTKDDFKDSVDDWFYGSLCKQSFLMLMVRRYNLISDEFLKILKKGALNSKLDPSTCLSAFLVQIEEYEGETRYQYQHLTQQYVLASLFLQNLKDHDKDDQVINSLFSLESDRDEDDSNNDDELKSLISDLKLYANDAYGCLMNEWVYNSLNRDESLEILKFYVEMSCEDGSMDADSIRVFYPIQKIINLIKNDDNGDKWRFLVSISILTNFNEKFMENVARAFKEIPFLDLNQFIFHFLEAKKILHIVRPRKIKLSYSSFDATRQEDLWSLLDILKELPTEIDLNVSNGEFPTSCELKETNENANSFYGTVNGFHDLREDRKFLEKVFIRICNVEDFRLLCRLLEQQEFNALDEIEIQINFHEFLLFPDVILSLPKGIIKDTILNFTDFIEEDFKIALKFLNKIKDDETLKFKALHHDFRFISKEIERELLEVAHNVSYEIGCLKETVYCLKRINNLQLNITGFEGNMYMLNFVNTYHANVKRIYIDIYSEDDLCSLLKFIHDYETNLSDVKIILTYDELSNFKNWKIRSFFDNNGSLTYDLKFPKGLVPLTTIFIPNIGEENFQDFITLLKNVKPDESSKFKGVTYMLHDLSPNKENEFKEMMKHYSNWSKTYLDD